MRNKYILIAVVLLTLAFGVGRLSAGTPDSPSAPGATNSFTLEDIYNRLNAGTAGAKSTFTEPAAGPGTGTMHTLNEIMAAAPALDATNGAGVANVASGKTFWGLTAGAWGLKTGAASGGGGAGVPKTGAGALSDYTLVAGEDGLLQKGVAWPNPRFTDNSNGTVTDNLTGLIWLKNANCTTFFSGDGTGNARSWANALTAANSLANGYCGLTDGSTAGAWRLPNVRELQSLLHYGFYGPAVPNTAGTGQWTEGNPFTGDLSDFYWSSTTDAYDSSDARYVYLPDGNVYDVVKTNAYYVWPVRGGQ